MEPQYKDRLLAGDYAGFRECHIASDWLLVYRIEKNALELLLFRTGNSQRLILRKRVQRKKAVLF